MKIKHVLVVIVGFLLTLTCGCMLTTSRAERYRESQESTAAQTRFRQYEALNPTSSSELTFINTLPQPISYKLVLNDNPGAWRFGIVEATSESTLTVPNFEYRFQAFVEKDEQDKEAYYQSSPFYMGRECVITVYQTTHWETQGLLAPFTLSLINSTDFWR